MVCFQVVQVVRFLVQDGAEVYDDRSGVYGVCCWKR
jgi:hypothetical protein